MLMINLAGLLLIALIIWWFWLYKPEGVVIDTSKVDKNEFVITVENGTYSPSRIKIAANKPMSIQFMRKDPSPCAEAVLIPALQISESLPLNKLKTIQLPAMDAGEYDFHCQMNMIQGKITVS